LLIDYNTRRSPFPDRQDIVWSCIGSDRRPSPEKRAEESYAEYRRQKASGSGGGGFRLSLC
jgi:hypothetical protein